MTEPSVDQDRRRGIPSPCNQVVYNAEGEPRRCTAGPHGHEGPHFRTEPKWSEGLEVSASWPKRKRYTLREVDEADTRGLSVRVYELKGYHGVGSLDGEIVCRAEDYEALRAAHARLTDENALLRRSLAMAVREQERLQAEREQLKAEKHIDEDSWEGDHLGRGHTVKKFNDGTFLECSCGATFWPGSST